IYQGGRRRARLATASLGFIGCFIPQPAVLAMLAEESRKHPSFMLHMGTAVRDLIRSGDRVVGVWANGPDGSREFPADLVIGTDGRYSTVRKRGAFTELPSPQHFDVLNFMVPFPDFWPDRTTVRLELGPGCLTGGIPTADGRLWVGMTIQKGQYKALHAAGPDGFTEELLHRTSPDLAAHLRANLESLKHPVLLDVIVGRLETWTAPGLLLLGDAAHPMAPNGGQRINVPLRDPLVAGHRRRHARGRDRRSRPPDRGGADAGDRRDPGTSAETDPNVPWVGPLRAASCDVESPAARANRPGPPVDREAASGLAARRCA